MLRNGLIIALILAVAGGAYYWYQDTDTRYARQVMDCMYAGSLEPIQDTLNPEARKALDNPQVKAQLPQAAAQMKQVYGAVKTLKFKSEGPVEGPFAQAFGKDSVQKTWTATSDKGTFDWTLFVDKDGKLLSMIPGRLNPI